MGALAERVLAGEIRAAARLMRLLDDEVPAAYAELKALFPHTGRAFIIGITGSPGAGKSTLTDRLIHAFRAEGRTVGVVAIDPTSPFSGGAILGDRIRMQQHETDPGVFIRSLATRGNLGGLSRSTRDIIHVLDALGKDVILVETVGVGQDEVDVVGTAHTSVVVLVPGMGDDIQAIKAGILEIADIFVLNKADREGADRTEREIRMMIELGGPGRDNWRPSIVRTVAVRDEGIAELVEAIAAHRSWAEETGRLQDRRREFVEATFRETLSHRLWRRAERLLGGGAAGELSTLRARLEAGEVDPYSAAEQTVQALLRPELHDEA